MFSRFVRKDVVKGLNMFGNEYLAGLEERMLQEEQAGWEKTYLASLEKIYFSNRSQGRFGNRSLTNYIDMNRTGL